MQADRPLCGARTRSGGICQNPPMDGGARCRMHGGASPQARAAAERRQQEAALTVAAAKFAAARDVDPAQALLDEIAVTQGWVDWLRARIEDLEPDMLVRGTRLMRRTESDEHGVTVVTEVGPGVSEWWKLYQEQRKHLVATCAAALAAGIARRQIELAEQDGLRIAGAVRGILAELGFSADDPRVREVVPRHLRAVRGGAA